MTTITRTLLLITACIFAAIGSTQSQSLQSSLQQAFRRFMSDEQMKYAMVGFMVQDTAGNTIFSNSENVGMAPASTQKIVTAAAALGKLSPTYRFPTKVAYNGAITNSALNGDLLVYGSGDPTLGTWRYPSQPDTTFFFQVFQALQAKGISSIKGDVVGSNNRFSVQPIPDGWIYGDMGNYYGAGTWALNYHENQYEATFNASGKMGDTLALQKAEPEPGVYAFNSFIKLGASGSGDNSVIYSAPYSSMAYATGTLGKTNQAFSVSGAVPDGETALLEALMNYLAKKGIKISGKPLPSLYFAINAKPVPVATQELTTFQSVGLDSVVYWFLQKSINLYGEALAKSLAFNAGKTGETEAGTDIIREFWASKGIDKDAVRIKDGCGLSPQNRVTAKSLVQVLQYARRQSWFYAFYDGLPLIHDIKMKSGTIGGVKSYAGYLTNRNGKTYAFSLIVNNFTGTANSVMQKMWSLLDVVVNSK